MTARHIQKPLAEMDALDQYVVDWTNPAKDQYRAKDALVKLLQADDVLKEGPLRQEISALKKELRGAKADRSNAEGAVAAAQARVRGWVGWVGNVARHIPGAQG